MNWEKIKKTYFDNDPMKYLRRLSIAWLSFALYLLIKNWNLSSLIFFILIVVCFAAITYIKERKINSNKNLEK